MRPLHCGQPRTGKEEQQKVLKPAASRQSEGQKVRPQGTEQLRAHAQEKINKTLRTPFAPLTPLGQPRQSTCAYRRIVLLLTINKER